MVINETAINISRRRPIRAYIRAIHANAGDSSLLVLGVCFKNPISLF